MFLSIPAIVILKVIFDRVEDPKLWWILLGDETGIKKSRIYTKLERMKFKNILEKKLLFSKIETDDKGTTSTWHTFYLDTSFVV